LGKAKLSSRNEARSLRLRQRRWTPSRAPGGAHASSPSCQQHKSDWSRKVTSGVSSAATADTGRPPGPTPGVGVQGAGGARRDGGGARGGAAGDGDVVVVAHGWAVPNAVGLAGGPAGVHRLWGGQGDPRRRRPRRPLHALCRRRPGALSALVRGRPPLRGAVRGALPVPRLRSRQLA
jgi:hypothetical protein